MSHSRWRAPREQGAVLVVPTWQELPALVAHNREQLDQLQLTIGQVPYQEARRLAWDSIQQATQHWSTWANHPASPLRRPLLMTGHQPELYHPGVWAKNIAIHQLAKKLGGSGANLNVDSDVAKSLALKIPVNQEDRPDTQLPLGPPLSPRPYEEWQCQNEGSFAEVANAFEKLSHYWPWQPALPAFWKMVVDQKHKTTNIPIRWLLARQQWERIHGVANHEFTMSDWCSTPFFEWLLQIFIQDAHHFATVYNEELLRYRQEHRIRSAHHPVAELLIQNDLVELPFWAWERGSSQRSRLCVRKHIKSFTLVSLQAGRETVISTQGFGFTTQGLAGWKFRPKALITSMLFRLFVADLFVHGIGGAVYDELTDRIFARYWKVTLPRFAVITATMRLPWNREPIENHVPTSMRQELRSMQWNPDRFLQDNHSSIVSFLREEKARWTDHEVPVTQLKERHEQLDVIRAQLQPLIADKQQSLQTQINQTLHQVKWDQHHFSREYSWVLYPETLINDLIAAFPI